MDPQPPAPPTDDILEELETLRAAVRRTSRLAAPSFWQDLGRSVGHEIDDALAEIEAYEASLAQMSAEIAAARAAEEAALERLKARAPSPPRLPHPPPSLEGEKRDGGGVSADQEPAKLFAEPQAVLGMAWGKILDAVEVPLAETQKRLRILVPSLDLQRRRHAIQAFFAASEALESVRLLRLHVNIPAAEMRGQFIGAALDGVLSSWAKTLRRKRASLVRASGTEFAATLDPKLLKLAAHQILKNAYEAVAPGGCVTVKSALSEGGEEIRLAIFDTGPGFPKEVLEKPFAAFQSTKTGHIGLGLSLARRLLQKMGGDIELANGPQRGAVVVIKLRK